MEAIAFDRVSARYATDGTLRLRDVSATLRAGELCALCGANGAGKSTLLRVAAGLLRTASGEVRLFGTPLAELGRQAIARRVALLPQRADVALGFTVREVVAMGRAPHQGALLRASRDDERAVARALARAELGAVSDRRMAELSGGEQRRVHVARALAQEAPVLLLDEPTAHLDLRHAHALWDLVRAEVSERGLACLVSMHDLEAAARWADRIVLLERGRVLADGVVAEVLTEESLLAAFGVRVRVGVDAPSGQRYFVANDG
jgi:iron complex transport system ATP-binding protein